MGPHPSHKTRGSDASTFDEICVNCGAHNEIGGWGQLVYECPHPNGRPPAKPIEPVVAPVVKAEKPWPPTDYNTPAYDARWIREKLKLPAGCPVTKVQGAMHVICSHADGYERYITAFKCDDKQGEIARLTVEVDLLRNALKELAGMADNTHGEPDWDEVRNRCHDEYQAALDRQPKLATPPPAMAV